MQLVFFRRPELKDWELLVTNLNLKATKSVRYGRSTINNDVVFKNHFLRIQVHPKHPQILNFQSNKPIFFGSTIFKLETLNPN